MTEAASHPQGTDPLQSDPVHIDPLLEDPLRAVREAAAFVATHSEHVRIDESALGEYAATLPTSELRADEPLELPGLGSTPEERAAFVLQIDAINFGSGYWPKLRKRPGLSGYRTVEACLLDRFRTQGPPSAEWLAKVEPTDCAELFGQTQEEPIGELMAHFARAWNELGTHTLEAYGGRFLAWVDQAQGSAPTLVKQMLELPMFRDIARYRGRTIPLLKRAQIVAADLAAALPPPYGTLRQLDQLTLFADNLIPHVLRIDGVLRFSHELSTAIESEELLVAGSEPEVEMRACAVHAVELISSALRSRGHAIHPHMLDRYLWQRGSGPRYKSQPRPRARSIYY